MYPVNKQLSALVVREVYQCMHNYVEPEQEQSGIPTITANTVRGMYGAMQVANGNFLIDCSGKSVIRMAKYLIALSHYIQDVRAGFIDIQDDVKVNIYTKPQENRVLLVLGCILDLKNDDMTADYTEDAILHMLDILDRDVKKTSGLPDFRSTNSN